MTGTTFTWVWMWVQPVSELLTVVVATNDHGLATQFAHQVAHAPREQIVTICNN